MEKEYDINTIISVDDFKRNQKKHLERDAQNRKNQKKEKAMNIVGIVAFYLMITLAVVVINARFKQINGQQKSATEPRIQIAQNNHVN